MMRSKRGLAGALLLVCAFSCNRCAQRTVPRTDPEAAVGAAAAIPAIAAIRSEARAFYRDLDARDTPALLNHFWPAKIAARSEPPFQPAPARPALVSAAIFPAARGAPAEECGAADAAIARADVTVTGKWARVIVPRCTRGDDELWMLELEGRWKIVRLALSGER